MLEFSTRMQDRIKSDMDELNSRKSRLDQVLPAKQAQQEGTEASNKGDGQDSKVHPRRTESSSASLCQS